MTLRIDGRRPDQPRPLRMTTGYLITAEGSVLIEVGQTRVLCATSIEDTVPQFLRGQGKGWVTAEYSMLPRAHRVPRAARGGERPAERTYARNPAADRPLSAGGGGHDAAG